MKDTYELSLRPVLMQYCSPQFDTKKVKKSRVEIAKDAILVNKKKNRLFLIMA